MLDHAKQPLGVARGGPERPAQLPSRFTFWCWAGVGMEAVAGIVGLVAPQNVHNPAILVAMPLVLLGFVAFGLAPVALGVGIVLARRRGLHLLALEPRNGILFLILIAQTTLLLLVLVMSGRP